MEISLIYLYASYFLVVPLLVMAAIIYAAFVIPLQYKESRVKNGLAVLRKQMLAKGTLAFATCVLAAFSIVGRFVFSDPVIWRYLIVTAIDVFAICMFGKALIDFRIYHQQFSEESKKLHEKFEKHELKEKLEAKLDKKKKK